MKYSPDEVISIINRYVDPPLRKAGQQWFTRCPFHDDQHPSFSVDPDRGVWHCFGCQASGGMKAFLERVGAEPPAASRPLGYSTSLATCNQVVSTCEYLRDLGEEGVAASIEHCRDDFRYMVCRDCHREFVTPVSCGQRLCPKCALSRSTLFFQEHRDTLAHLGTVSLLELNCPERAHLTKALVKEARGIFEDLRKEVGWRRAVRGGVYGLKLRPTHDGWAISIIVLAHIHPDAELPIMAGWILRFKGQRASIRLRPMGSLDMATDEFQHLCALPPTWFRDVVQFGEYYFTTKGMALFYGFGDCYRVHGGLLRGQGGVPLKCPYCGSLNVKYLGVVNGEFCTCHDGIWSYDGPRPSACQKEGVPV